MHTCKCGDEETGSCKKGIVGAGVVVVGAAVGAGVAAKHSAKIWASLVSDPSKNWSLPTAKIQTLPLMKVWVHMLLLLD